MILLNPPSISDAEIEEVTKTLKSGWISYKSPVLKEFEKAFSDYVGRTSYSCSSGTAALHLALLALDIGPGDEVIVPNLTFGTCGSVVLATGAKLVLVDVQKNFCINPELVSKAVTPRTKAVIAVDLYGNAADIEALIDIVPSNVTIIQDSCEGLGYVSPRADIVCYSFFANKLITTGEGGIICPNISGASRIKDFRDGGFDSSYRHRVPGLNYRLTGIQAAIGLAQLGRIDQFLKARQVVLDRYDENLEGQGKWLFLTKVKSRNLEGVETRPVFYPLHLQAPFKQSGEFETSLDLWRDYLCLPTGPHLSIADVDYISNEVMRVNSFLQRVENGGSVVDQSFGSH